MIYVYKYLGLNNNKAFNIGSCNKYVYFIIYTNILLSTLLGITYLKINEKYHLQDCILYYLFFDV